MSRETINGLEERIRTLLKEKGWSIKKLCKETDISPYVMETILTKSLIHGTDAVKIAEKFDITTDYLLRGIEVVKEDKPRLCKVFKCIYDPGNHLCCHSCPQKSDCEYPCQNHPNKCKCSKIK